MKKLLNFITSFFILFSLLGCSWYFPPTGYEGLTYTAFGDSITYGADCFNNCIQMNTPYVNQVGKILHLKSNTNKGINGATLTNNTGTYNITTDITSFSEKRDIISVLGGVNDYGNSLTLGTISDRDNSTIYGSLHISMNYLTTNYKDSLIFYMTPYKCRNCTDKNSAGYTLENLATAIKEVAAIYNIPVLDLFNEGNFESVMNNPNCDGLHPNQEFILSHTAPQIARFIKENYK